MPLAPTCIGSDPFICTRSRACVRRMCTRSYMYYEGTHVYLIAYRYCRLLRWLCISSTCSYAQARYVYTLTAGVVHKYTDTHHWRENFLSRQLRVRNGGESRFRYGCGLYHYYRCGFCSTSVGDCQLFSYEHEERGEEFHGRNQQENQWACDFSQYDKHLHAECS